MVPGHAAQADALLPQSHSLRDLRALHGSPHSQESVLGTGSLAWGIVGTALRPGT